MAAIAARSARRARFLRPSETRLETDPLSSYRTLPTVACFGAIVSSKKNGRFAPISSYQPAGLP